MAEQKRHRLRIVLIVLAIVLGAAIAGTVVVAATFDANRLRPRIIAAIRTATHRDVTIDGPIRLGLSLRPVLEVDDVKLGNAPGFAPASMATLDRLDLRLALLPLLHRHIEIEQLDLFHPTITLQIDAHGRDNWHFDHPVVPARAATPATPSTTQRTTLRIDTMTVTDGAISFADARTGASFAMNAVQLTALQGDPDGPIHLALDGSKHTIPLAVAGDIGRPHDGFMPIDLTVKAAGGSMTVSGRAPRFTANGSISDVAALSPLAGVGLPAWRDVSFRADLAPPNGETYASGIVLGGLHLSSPLGVLVGNATVTFAPPIAVSATLQGIKLDPAALIAALPPPAAPAPPSASGPAATALPSPATPAPVSSASTTARLITDRPLPFGSLPRVDADLRLTLHDTKVGSGTVSTIATHAVLHAGRLVLDPLAVDLPGGHVDASAMADAAGAVAVTLRAPSLSIQPFLAAFDQPDGVLGSVGVRADLRGAGMTPHTLAAGLDGSVGLALADGEVDNRLLVALLSRLAPEAGLLDLDGKAGRSVLRCVALRVDISHGAADLRALLLDTAPLRLTGGGTFDLGQETLALHLLPLARIGGSGLSVPVDVRGTLRAPRAAVNTTVGKGLGGLVIGALGADRLIAGAGEADGCAEQLQLARFGDAGPVPAALPAPATVKRPPMNANNLLKQLLR